MKIEIYTDHYKRSAIELILNIQVNEFKIPITINEQPDLTDITGYYKHGNGNFWIALMDGLVVGSIALLDIGNGSGALRKMFVDRRYRGKEIGIAQKLLSNLFVWAKDKGMSEVYLGTTEKFTAAQRFYEKNGFWEIKRNALPKSFPIMDVDVKFYQISF